MRRILLLVFFSFVINLAFSQPTLYVDSSRASGGNGTSWSTAFKELREALAFRKAHMQQYTILVAKGTYKTSATGNSDTAFVFSGSTLAIAGGYPSGGGGQNATANRTILSGDLGFDSIENYYKRSSHVVVAVHISQFFLDGFTISHAASPYYNYDSVYFDGQKVNADEGGGIVLLQVGNQTRITNCIFSENDQGRGGGISAVNSGTIISDCIFRQNFARYGGGIWADHSNLTIRNCRFYKNVGDDWGGGISNEESNPVIAFCLFQENQGNPYNTSTYEILGGGAIHNISSNPKISGCVFYKDSASRGGAILNTDLSRPEISNCDFVSNNAWRNGGCIVNNYNAVAAIDNCIIWHNTAANNSIIINEFSGNCNIKNSLIQGGFVGSGNISSDPKFVNEADIDGPNNIFGNADDGLRLQDISPAINRGNNAAVEGTGDVAGSTRIQAGTVDIGAYESSTNPTVVYVDSSVTTSGSGYGWSAAYRELRDATLKASTDERVKTIMVAKGTYKPTANSSRDSAFVFYRGLKIYGGYPNGGGTRNAALNPTILSGDIGTVNNTADNSYHLIIIAGLDAADDSLVVDGFTITKGFANGAGTKSFNGQSFKQNEGAGAFLVVVSNKTAFRNCTFSYNVSTGNGGGVLNSGASPTFLNCLIYGNKADIGGGVFNYASSPLIINCTITEDTATSRGGGIYSNMSSQNVINSIVWNNKTSFGAANIDVINSTDTVSYSIVQSGFVGAGNLNADPMFVNAAADSFQLQSCSPATNAGLSAALPTGITTDLAGSPRIFNAGIDIGVYENIMLPATFTFKGVGNWTVPANWQCNWVPPASLPSGSEIIIDPVGGDCILNTSYTLPAGGKLTIKAGKKLTIL